MKKATCPICGQNDVPSTPHGTKDVCSFDCPVCGDYAITRQAKVNMQSMAKEDKAKISAFTRERQIHQRPKVTVLSDSLNSPSIAGATVGMDDILKAGFPSTVSERLDRTMMNLSLLSTRPGVGIPLSGKQDYPLFFAEDEDAYLYLRDALVSDDLIRYSGSTVSPTITLTPNGWNRIVDLEREKGRKDSKQYNHILWTDEVDLCEKLRRRIEATIPVEQV